MTNWHVPLAIAQLDGEALVVCTGCGLTMSRAYWTSLDGIGCECGAGAERLREASTAVRNGTPASARGDRWPGCGRSHIQLPSSLLEHRQALGLTASDIVLLLGLERHRWTSVGEVRPGLRRLQDLTGLTRATILRRTKALEKKGYLTIDRGDSTRPNRYTWPGLIDALSRQVEASEQVVPNRTTPGLKSNQKQKKEKQGTTSFLLRANCLRFQIEPPAIEVAA